MLHERAHDSPLFQRVIDEGRVVEEGTVHDLRPRMHLKVLELIGRVLHALGMGIEGYLPRVDVHDAVQHTLEGYNLTERGIVAELEHRGVAGEALLDLGERCCLRAG